MWQSNYFDEIFYFRDFKSEYVIKTNLFFSNEEDLENAELAEALEEFGTNEEPLEETTQVRKLKFYNFFNI